MNNSLVKAVIDTGKPDTIEFQLLPGHTIQKGDLITYDKLDGVQFLVETVSPNDWAKCIIQGGTVESLKLYYFQPMTTLFVMNREVEAIYSDNTDSIKDRVWFPD